MAEVDLNEEFRWKSIKVLQQKDVFKIGTDALLLSAWIPKIIKEPALILDVGTGTGILAMIMGLFFPEAKIVGIDLEEAAVHLAAYNFQHSVWPERLSVRQENILEAHFPEKDLYDLVLCNPPFYFDQYPAKIRVNINAKHATESSLSWLEALAGRLKSQGHLCIILPSEMTFEWIRSANEMGLYCQHRLNTFTFRDDVKPKRTLLHFHSNLIKPEISNLDIHDQSNTYTKEYNLFYGIDVNN